METQNREPMNKRIVVRMTSSEAKRLEEIKRQGRYPHTATMVRSMLRAIIADDAKAHGKA